MANFAQLSGDVVSNVLKADSKEELESILSGKFVQYTEDNPAGIGWTYNAETGEFTAPIVEEDNA